MSKISKTTSPRYPIAEHDPERVRAASGKPLDEISLDSILAGETEIADLRISAESLIIQAEVARSSGRDALAKNFLRAAEMTRIPQSTLFEIYELLRPGRAKERATLNEAAIRLRREFDAPSLAALIEEAAEVYERRGIFQFRF